MRHDDPSITSSPSAASDHRPPARVRAWFWAGLLVVLMGLTSLALAHWGSIWLVPLYLLGMVLILFPAGRREDVARLAGPGPQSIPGPEAASDRAEVGSDHRPPAKLEPVAGSSAEIPGVQEPAPEPVVEKTRRARGRGRGKASAAADPPGVTTTWVRVGPGKFVRAEMTIPPTEDPPPTSELEPSRPHAAIASADEGLPESESAGPAAEPDASAAADDGAPELRGEAAPDEPTAEAFPPSCEEAPPSCPPEGVVATESSGSRECAFASPPLPDRAAEVSPVITEGVLSVEEPGRVGAAASERPAINEEPEHEGNVTPEVPTIDESVLSCEGSQPPRTPETDIASETAEDAAPESHPPLDCDADATPTIVDQPVIARELEHQNARVSGESTDGTPNLIEPSRPLTASALASEGLPESESAGPAAEPDASAAAAPELRGEAAPDEPTAEAFPPSCEAFPPSCEEAPPSCPPEGVVAAESSGSRECAFASPPLPDCAAEVSPVITEGVLSVEEPGRVGAAVSGAPADGDPSLGAAGVEPAPRRSRTPRRKSLRPRNPSRSVMNRVCSLAAMTSRWLASRETRRLRAMEARRSWRRNSARPGGRKTQRSAQAMRWGNTVSHRKPPTSSGSPRPKSFRPRVSGRADPRRPSHPTCRLDQRIGRFPTPFVGSGDLVLPRR